MKIGIDVRMVQNFPTGIGNYRRHLIEALLDLPSKHQIVLIGNVGNKVASVFVRSKPNSVHQHFLLPLELRRLSLDLFWTTPWGASVFLRSFRQPYALTIYDLLYRRYPELASFKARLYETLVSGWIAHRAEMIFTISDFVKEDIINFLEIDEKKVFNIRGAAGEAYKPLSKGNFTSLTRNKFGISTSYFVYLGNFRPHKNLPTLLKAFAKVKSKMENVRLVLIGDVDARGRAADSRKIQAILTKLALQNDVILTGRIPDDWEVAAILSEAVALVHPSFHEGFGLTVLEAMSCGTPVIAANTTSLPEVAGNAGILVDPYDVDELAAAMEKVYKLYTYDRTHYKKLSRKCLEQARKFSWKKSAEEVLRVFDSFASMY